MGLFEFPSDPPLLLCLLWDDMREGMSWRCRSYHLLPKTVNMALLSSLKFYVCWQWVLLVRSQIYILREILWHTIKFESIRAACLNSQPSTLDEFVIESISCECSLYNHFRATYISLGDTLQYGWSCGRFSIHVIHTLSNVAICLFSSDAIQSNEKQIVIYLSSFWLRNCLLMCWHPIPIC